MPQHGRLQEQRRTHRRTVADALDVAGRDLAPNEILRAQIEIAPLQLPSGECTALVDVVFPELGCRVSLPTSDRFRALSETGSQREEFEISRLDGAEVCPDGSVLLADGMRLRAVEVIATYLPYRPSDRDERILRHVIALTESYHCYRSIREGLPEHLHHLVPDVRALDCSRVRSIQAPPLKVIRGYIEDNDPRLKVSNQKIADALARFGVRVPRRRARTLSNRAVPLVTI